MEQYYEICLSGIDFRCKFEFPETAAFFGQYCKGPFPGEADIEIPSWYWDLWKEKIGPKTPHNEYSAFSAVCSSALLPLHRCVFHAAAIRWNNNAYLITAPPGVGKSTRVKTLQELYREEFTVISGDRPILAQYDDGTVMVHPSPWNGKEDWYGAKEAPLKGVILLERGTENRIVSLSANEAALELYRGFFTLAETEEELKQVAAMETAVLKAAPVWKLTIQDIEASTKLLYGTVFDEPSTCKEEREEL